MKMMYLNQAKFKEIMGKIDTVIIPIGTIETHGEHLPLGTDVLIPEGLCERIDAKMGERILIAPSVNYGHVWALAAFPGCVNISMGVLQEYIYEIGKSFVEQGFKNIVLLNGHGGNNAALGVVGEMLADLGATVVTFHWWMDFRAEILQFCEGQGHAGEDETSAALAVAEPYCDMSLARVNNRNLIANIKWKGMGLTTYEHGLSGDATKGTKEKGEKMLDLVAQRMVEIIERVWKNDIEVES